MSDKIFYHNLILKCTHEQLTDLRNESDAILIISIQLHIL